MTAESPSSSDGWEARPPMKAQGPNVSQIEWGGNQHILSALYQ